MPAAEAAVMEAAAEVMMTAEAEPIAQSQADAERDWRGISVIRVGVGVRVGGRIAVAVGASIRVVVGVAIRVVGVGIVLRVGRSRRATRGEDPGGQERRGEEGA